MKEACSADQGFEFRQSCLGHGGRGRKSPEQLWGDHVDADVSALGGEDCGYEQLPRGTVSEGADCVRISLVQPFKDGGDAGRGERIAR